MCEKEIVTKVILVGVGSGKISQSLSGPGRSPSTVFRGATCSGKTTLAKHLNRTLPDSVIIHQDDFAPAQHLIPIHPTYGVQDWDAAPGAIDWPLFTSFLRRVKAVGDIPPDHRSHDHLNEQKELPVGKELQEKWKTVFDEFKAQQESKGTRIVWGLVDGFLLYWHPDAVKQLDVQFFLRVPHDVLKQRRHERHGYHTAVQSDAAEDTLWRDPPGYWEQIVYPAYVEAHGNLFEDGDVEHGRPLNTELHRFNVLDGSQMDMDDLLESSCRALAHYIHS